MQEALRRQGLESSNLILAVDFTKSNEWTGKQSYNGRSLHHLGPSPNPYEEAMSIIARTLSPFDDDQLYPCWGFGDASTTDRGVFSFMPNDAPCQGLEAALWRYREIAPAVRLAGPTSFAPAIYQAMQLVADSGGQYHILVIIADGQVTRSSDTVQGEFSVQEAATVEAIVAASQLPLSIIMIGVGDGPWDVMQQFDDQLPARAFDNFQFVNFTEVAYRYPADSTQREAAFALKALMEIPDQYKAIQSLKLLGKTALSRPRQTPLPPPLSPHTAHFQPYPPQNPYYQPGMMQNPHIHTPQSGFGTFVNPGQPQRHYYPSLGQPTWGSGYGTSGGGYPQVSPAGVGDGIRDGARHDQERKRGMHPESFLCPITQEMMKDPVIAADGYTYERNAIQDWLQQQNRSPMTNQPLEHKMLTPNRVLKSAIAEAGIQRQS